MKNFTCPYCEDELPIKLSSKKCPTCYEELPTKLRKEIDDYYFDILEKQRNQVKLNTEKSQNKNINIIRIQDDKNILEKKEEIAERQEINCPYCDELISSRAKKCKHCGEFLDKNASNNSLKNYLPAPNRNMDIWECVQYGFKNIFNTNDRTTRREHFIYSIVIVVLLVIYYYIAVNSINKISQISLLVMSIIFFPIILLTASAVRRLKDSFDNKFIISLPYIHNVLFIVWYIWKGVFIVELMKGFAWIFLIISIICLLFPSKK